MKLRLDLLRMRMRVITRQIARLGNRHAWICWAEGVISADMTRMAMDRAMARWAFFSAIQLFLITRTSSPSLGLRLSR